MAIKVYRLSEEEDELRDSLNVTSEYTLQFAVDGAKTREAAWIAMYENVPKSFRNMKFSGARINGFKDDMWNFTAQYNISTESDSDSEKTEPQMSFDLSTGSETIKRSLAQTWKSKNAKETGGYIGWDGKSTEVAGVTVVTGTMRESYTKHWKPAKLDTTYRRTLFEQAGRVNGKAFRGWSKGEVLFLGATFSGNASGSDTVAVTYHFAIQQNEAATSINGIAVPAKWGWEYVWSIAAIKTAQGVPVVVVDGIYFEQVYKLGDFGRLKI